MSVPTRLVDVAGRHPGAHRRHSRRLGLGHDVEHPGQGARGLAAHAERARHVGPVPLEDGAEVHHDGVSFHDDALGRPRMGFRRVRP